ncbi:DMT family transporter [Vibrio ziniensis]|uniref:EamA family transporter n=1 Tax=Vibrio ziniensis TaxID=2711221 RepID=A0A6G7CQD5_9VIBR|nr:DMT family transporter [Vibrio ziniensis]QIH44302.1 EamA family transporter [Vibrio ziniensis]
MLFKNRAVPYMLISTFSMSLTGLILKKLTEMMGIELLTFLRFLMPALLLFAMVAVSKLPLPPRTVLKPIIIRGLCIAACQLCFIASLNTLTLVESSVLFGTGPLFIAVLEKLFFKVNIKTETKFGLVATFAGVLLLAGDVTGIQFRPELLFGLGAGLFNAGSQVSLFRASKREVKPAVLNSWTFLIAAIAVLPLSFIFGLSDMDTQILLEPQHNLLVWGCLFVLSITVVGNQILRSKAYKLADSNSQLAPLIFTNLLFTAIWQVLFFDETFSHYQVVGIALIIIASLMNSFAAKVFKHFFHTKAHQV